MILPHMQASLCRIVNTLSPRRKFYAIFTTIGITIICDYRVCISVSHLIPMPSLSFSHFFLRAQKIFMYSIHTCKKKVRKGKGEPGNEATEAIPFSVTSFGENFSSKVYSTIIM